MTDAPLPEPGWYPDPSGAPTLRWWNGVTWSDATHPLMPAEPQPLAVPPTAPAPASQVWSPVVPPPSDALPASEAEPTARRRRWWIPLVAIVALLALGITAVSALLAGSPRLDTGAIQTRIAAELSAEAQERVTVDCPSRVEIRAGSTFTCTASYPDGGDVEIVVLQTSARGDVRWSPVR